MGLESAIAFAMRKAGVAALKEKQRECIFRSVEGNDVFTSLPTGYGKSLIYGRVISFYLLVQQRQLHSAISPLNTLSLISGISSKFL